MQRPAWIFPGEIGRWLSPAALRLPEPGHNPDGVRSQGFVTKRLQRIALAALGDTAARLLPLIEGGMHSDCSITLFTDSPLSQLPSRIEVYPLRSLPEVLDWAQFLLLDVPVGCLSGLRAALGLGFGQSLSCPAQVLIYAPMPCGGLADCGVCAIAARRGWKLVCKDGPVFNLDQLQW
jgi:hypothetical protein